MKSESPTGFELRAVWILPKNRGYIDEVNVTYMAYCQREQFLDSCLINSQNAMQTKVVTHKSPLIWTASAGISTNISYVTADLCQTQRIINSTTTLTVKWQNSYIAVQQPRNCKFSRQSFCKRLYISMHVVYWLVGWLVSAFETPFENLIQFL
uniref:Uncharacterized protein n=1 Tax=Glossina pallidipes TaxID=7398 RepID=A0A1A9ZZF7_GLOPL